ncbi:hypothetical protein SAMN05216464_102326 [Mucilaginibacter pineti]|uniref:Fasciclin domain-containing protein n=1 Tax=Mucilaginibacter pineti TaxID=1391627 RepID=A0A1G6WX96_9SPHI|nr:hypothetical protein [Mucilaginibacter pineti]SDD70434.1 hypothetical protein SAMN05216464_102326 [Mucilaginibacter pineti]
MRNKNVFFFRTLLAVLLSTTLFACKKTDLAYYNYENNLKDYKGSALEYIKSQPGVYDSLMVVLDRLPALEDSLQNENVTLFAVTNKSFQISVESLNAVRKKTNKAPIYLATADLAQLDTMMCKYIIPGKLTTADFESYSDGLLIKSLKYQYAMHVAYKKANASGFNGGGPAIITFTDPKNSIFVRYWQSTPTNAVNIKTSNAVVNVIAPGHDFGFGDFVTRINH